MNSTASTSQSNTRSYSALAEENALQREQLEAQAESIRQLKHQLDWFKKQLFGPKSEKQVYDIPEQDSLFTSGEAPLPEKPAEEEKRTIKAYQRGTGKKSPGPTRAELSDRQARDLGGRSELLLSQPEPTESKITEVRGSEGCLDPGECLQEISWDTELGAEGIEEFVRRQRL